MGHIYPLSVDQPFDWLPVEGSALAALSPAAFAIITTEPPTTQPATMEWWAEATGYSTTSAIHRAFQELVQAGLAERRPWKTRSRYVTRPDRLQVTA